MTLHSTAGGLSWKILPFRIPNGFSAWIERNLRVSAHDTVECRTIVRKPYGTDKMNLGPYAFDRIPPDRGIDRMDRGPDGCRTKMNENVSTWYRFWKQTGDEFLGEQRFGRAAQNNMASAESNDSHLSKMPARCFPGDNTWRHSHRSNHVFLWEIFWISIQTRHLIRIPSTLTTYRRYFQTEFCVISQIHNFCIWLTNRFWSIAIVASLTVDETPLCIRFLASNCCNSTHSHESLPIAIRMQHRHFG